MEAAASANRPQVRLCGEMLFHFLFPNELTVCYVTPARLTYFALVGKKSNNTRLHHSLHKIEPAGCDQADEGSRLVSGRSRVQIRPHTLLFCGFFFFFTHNFLLLSFSHP